MYWEKGISTMCDGEGYFESVMGEGYFEKACWGVFRENVMGDGYLGKM